MSLQGGKSSEVDGIESEMRGGKRRGTDQNRRIFASRLLDEGKRLGRDPDDVGHCSEQGSSSRMGSKSFGTRTNFLILRRSFDDFCAEQTT